MYKEVDYPETTIVNTDCVREVEHSKDYLNLWSSRSRYSAAFSRASDPQVSIFFLAYNNLNRYTKSAIEALLKYTQDIDFELILIDNGSTDGTFEYFKSISYSKKRIYKITKNCGAFYGIAAAKQAGPRRFFRGKYFVALPNDVLVTKNWLHNMIRCIESDERIGIVVPMADMITNAQAVDLQYTDLDDMQKKAAQFNQSDPNKWEERLRAIPATSLIRTEVIEMYDSDSAFIYYFGDDDFSFAIRRMGYKLIVCGDVFVHHAGISAHTNAQEDFEKGKKIFQRKYYGIDSWKDTLNYEWCMRDCLLKECKNREYNRVLGIDVRCGTPLLDIKNGLRRLGMWNTELSAYTVDAKYWLDLKTICDGSVICGDIDRLSNKLLDDGYDYILLGEYLEQYESGEDIIQAAWEKLDNAGRLVFKLHSYDGIMEAQHVFDLMVMSEKNRNEINYMQKLVGFFRQQQIKACFYSMELSIEMEQYQKKFFQALSAHKGTPAFVRIKPLCTEEAFQQIVQEWVVVIER